MKKLLLTIIILLNSCILLSGEVSDFILEKEKVIKILKENKKYIKDYEFYSKEYFDFLLETYPIENKIIKTLKEVILTYNYSMLIKGLNGKTVQEYLIILDKKIKKSNKNKKSLLAFKNRVNKIKNYKEYYLRNKDEFFLNRDEVIIILNEVIK